MALLTVGRNSVAGTATWAPAATWDCLVLAGHKYGLPPERMSSSALMCWGCAENRVLCCLGRWEGSHDRWQQPEQPSPREPPDNGAERNPSLFISYIKTLSAPRYTFMRALAACIGPPVRKLTCFGAALRRQHPAPHAGRHAGAPELRRGGGTAAGDARARPRRPGERLARARQQQESWPPRCPRQVTALESLRAPLHCCVWAVKR